MAVALLCIYLLLTALQEFAYILSSNPTKSHPIGTKKRNLFTKCPTSIISNAWTSTQCIMHSMHVTISPNLPDPAPGRVKCNHRRSPPPSRNFNLNTQHHCNGSHIRRFTALTAGQLQAPDHILAGGGLSQPRLWRFCRRRVGGRGPVIGEEQGKCRTVGRQSQRVILSTYKLTYELGNYCWNPILR